MTSRIDQIGQNGNDGVAYADYNDNVNHPPHYQSEDGIECIDAIKAQMTKEQFVAYCQGNVVKYLWRWRSKGGAESLNKAAWYLKRMIEEVE